MDAALSLGRRPAGGAVVPAAAARARAARRAELAALGLVAPRRGASGRRRRTCRRRCSSLALVLLFVALARPEATVPQPRREGTVILAFDVSGEHGREGPRPEPDRRREGRGAHLRAAAAVDRAGGRRGVQRQRAGHPGAHHGPGDGARRDRPPHPAGRHGARERAADRARRHRREGRCCSTARPGNPVEPQGPDLGLPRLGRGDPALRRREHRRRRTRSTSPTSRRAPGCGSTRSGSAGPRARCCRSTASRSRPRWTSRCCARSPSTTDGTYFAGGRRAGAGGGLRLDRRWRGRSRTEHVELTALLRRPRPRCCCSSGAGLSLAWFGRAV